MNLINEEIKYEEEKKYENICIMYKLRKKNTVVRKYDLINI